jgi:hypothetical protein
MFTLCHFWCRRGLFTVWCLGVVATPGAAGEAWSLANLPERARDLSALAVARADALWDERAALLTTADGMVHGVRPTAWYALGLLVRDGPGDRARAVRAIDAVLQQQIHAPGWPWHGTFYRRAQEQRPLRGARMWDDYDPNWRQFIGCTLAQALIHYADRLPAALQARMREAIVTALEGEAGEGRLLPAYTNIALMQGFLLGFAGKQMDRPEWTAAAEAWVAEIHTAFQRHESFDEYNAPTYYGVDLYGLALLRARGATPALREAGTAMEAALWRDIGRFYHAGLRNLCGPYDRAHGTHGMMMEDYVALTGIWIGLVVPEALSPLPDLRAAELRHGNELLFAPGFALLGAVVPAEVQPHLERFQGERRLERPIDDGHRVATAWLSEKVMIGAQHTRLSRGVAHDRSAFHPVTLHWQRPDGGVSWLALRTASRVNAVAEAGRLTVEAIGDAVWRISAPGLTTEALGRELWTLPGLTLAVTSDACDYTAVPDATGVTITFHRATRMVFSLIP